jgi:mRNA-degrading endonuclease YafQ of YafQ-DinJ toxin-antitoxin module
MDALFSDAFVKSLKKHAGIKRAVQQKVNMIIADPIGLGEPLRGNFRGYYSCPVKKNFLIVYLFCRLCRRKKDDGVVRCSDCRDCPDETIKFIAFGPHDRAYQKGK